MKVLILGPGAIGSLFYFLLSRKVKSLWVLAKDKKKASYLREKGLKVEVFGSRRYHIPFNVFSLSEDVPRDIQLVLVCVKSYDTLSAAKSILRICKEKAYILSLQNGLGNLEILSEVLGEDRVLGGVTNQASTLIEPGWIRHTAEGQTIIGEPGKKISPILRDIRELFISCDIPTRISKDINSVIFSKLIINAGINPFTALLRLKNGELLKYREIQELVQMAVNEAERIAKRKKIRLAFEDGYSKLEAVCRATSENLSSMLQDVLKKKRTEIEAITGAICRLGQNLKIPTPVNFMMYRLIKSMEESYLQQVEKVL